MKKHFSIAVLSVLVIVAGLWFYLEKTPHQDNNSINYTIKSQNDTQQHIDSMKRKLSEFESGSISDEEVLLTKDLSVTAVESSNNRQGTTKAEEAKGLRVAFKIQPNKIARKGNRDVFLRVSDRNEEVLDASNEKRVFIVDDRLQYTSKAVINFTNNDETFVVDWHNPGHFAPGNYSVALYADGHLMGTKVFRLK